MSAAQKQEKKMSVKEALARWMKGERRTKLIPVTGLSRKALTEAFCKISGKTWQELDIESGRRKAPAPEPVKKSKAAKARKPQARKESLQRAA